MNKKLLFALAALLPQFACAETGYYLVNVYDVEGLANVDYKYWNAHYKDRATRAMPEIGLGYGVTSRWYTELSGSWFQIGGEQTRFVALEWQNDFLLTQGQYDWDVALHTTIERPRDRSQGYALEIGPALQTQFWRTQFNLNVFFQREFDNGEKNDTELVYQWQIKHRWKSWLQPGLQGFGELGKWNDWQPSDKQSHRLGPAVFGYVDAGANGQQIKYEAAYLVGKNSARTAKSFTMRVQYLF
ncbi:hypothetical protein [Pseudoduganella sp. RAF53_2]|jgi:hypothetical protein|uniref:hypothetical protein n=1 Tax=unclassified Pseudoduganella TaxID=2637179 RepID=UPI003F9DC4E6